MPRKHILPIVLAILLAGCLGFIFARSTEANPGEETAAGKYDTLKYNYIAHHAVLASPPIPANLDFCGEPVPLHDPDVRERLDFELVQNVYWHSMTIMCLKRANRYKETAIKILKENGIPEDFFYLMVAESGVSNATSTAGAQGYWQFMPETGLSYGLEINASIDERNDEIKSCYAACNYLNKSYQRYKNWTLAAASYNAGSGAIDYCMNTQGVDNYYDLYLNKETARYVYRILAYKIIMQNPEAYGFKFFPGDKYEEQNLRTITVNYTIPDLIAFAKQNGTTYKMVRVLNPWIKGSSLPNPTGKTYNIKLPAK